MIYPLIKVMKEGLQFSGLNIDDIDRAIGITQSVFGRYPKIKTPFLSPVMIPQTAL